jgi:hypothetical protein
MSKVNQLKEVFIESYESGNVELAEKTANLIKEYESLPSTPTDPNEAGVENIPYVGPAARVLAQPFYEGMMTVNLVANAPEFLGGIVNNTYNTYDLLTNPDEKENLQKLASKELDNTYAKINALQKANKEVPDVLKQEFIDVKNLKDKGMTWEVASKIAKMKSDKTAEEYLEKGVLGDKFIKYVLDANLPESSDQKEVLNVIKNLEDTIEKSNIIPSEETIMNETILGNFVKAFGIIINKGAQGLELLGVPKENAQTIAEAASLAVGPKFAKTVQGTKSRIGYTDAVKLVYGDMLGGVITKSDKLKAQDTISKLERELEKAKEEPVQVGKNYQKVQDLETLVKQARETFNANEYGIFRGARTAFKPDFKEFTLKDLAEFQTDGVGSILSPTGKIKTESRKLENIKEDFTKFEELTHYVANLARKVDQTTGLDMAVRMQNMFGKKNGFEKQRTMNQKTIKEYNDVVDFMEGTKNIVLNKEQLQLKSTLEAVMKEDRVLTKLLQKYDLISKDIPVQQVFFPRRFVDNKPTIAQNLFGDRFKINLGDRGPREVVATSDRKYFALENGGKTVYITLAEGAQKGVINPKTGKEGFPMVIVNGRSIKGKKYTARPAVDTTPQALLAHFLTKATKDFNDGAGLKRNGEVIPANSIPVQLRNKLKIKGDLKVREVKRAEFENIYTREVIKDPLTALVQSVNEKRQLARELIFSENVAKSAFGKRNMAIAAAVEKGISAAYDPLKPTKNVAKTSAEYRANDNRDVSTKQLTKEINIDLTDAGLGKLKGMKFSKRVAGVLEDAFRPYQKTMASKVSDAIVKNMMLNPIPHMHNELIHFYSTKGLLGTWNPKQLKAYSKDQAWAMDAVLNRTPEYVQLLRDGRSQMSVNVINSRGLDKILQQSTEKLLGDKTTRKWYDKFTKAAYKGSEGYAAISNFAQYSMWTTRDIMYMALVKQKMRTNKVDMDTAARLVELHMPTYRLPVTVGPEALMGYRVTRKVSQFLANPSIVIFARYKHGMLSSGLNTFKDMTAGLDPVLSKLGKPGQVTKNILGYENISLGRTKGKQFVDGLDSGMALASAWFIFYPLLDALYEEIFDGDEVKARRAGILHILETAAGVSSQQKDIHQMRQVLLTINPAFLLMYEMLMNETIYNGQEIYNVNDLLGSGSKKQFAKDIGNKLLTAIPQANTVINAQDDYEDFDLDKVIGRQVDAKIKTRRQTFKQAQRQAAQDTKNLNQILERGDLPALESYFEDYWENSDYYSF